MIVEADKEETHFDLFGLGRVMPVAAALISAYMNK